MSAFKNSTMVFSNKNQLNSTIDELGDEMNHEKMQVLT